MLAVGVASSAAVVWMMALTLLRPRRMSDIRASLILNRISPADLGLEYEAVRFAVIDDLTGGKLTIAGWWIPTPGAGGKCALIVHGYADAKVGGIAWAPLLRSLGFHVLAIDLRAHGESGGRFSTGGYWEQRDIRQVIDQFRGERPEQTRQMLLFGVSLGAASVAAAAVGREDLWAVILEAPFSRYRRAVGLQAERMGSPGPLFQSAAYYVAQWLAGADFETVSPVRTIPLVACPLMVIQSGDDPFLEEADHAEIRRAVASRDAKQAPSVNWDVAGVHHVVGLRMNPVEYRRQVEEFLSAVLQSRGEV